MTVKIQNNIIDSFPFITSWGVDWTMPTNIHHALEQGFIEGAFELYYVHNWNKEKILEKAEKESLFEYSTFAKAFNSSIEPRLTYLELEIEEDFYEENEALLAQEKALQKQKDELNTQIYALKNKIKEHQKNYLIEKYGAEYVEQANYINPLVDKCIEETERLKKKHNLKRIEDIIEDDSEEETDSKITIAKLLELSIINKGTLILPDMKKYFCKDFGNFSKMVKNIGGEYQPQKRTFVFPFNPERLIDRIKAGESLNIFQEYQFFPTPLPVIKMMCEGIDFGDVFIGKTVLEPSAGRGNIVDYLREKYDSIMIDCVEFMPENREILVGKGHYVIGEDFLTLEGCENKYDLIIANPPFTKGQDIKHFYKMFEVCKESGTIVSIMSQQWKDSDRKEAVRFREFLAFHKAEITWLNGSEFKESGTTTPTAIIRLRKIPVFKVAEHQSFKVKTQNLLFA